MGPCWRRNRLLRRFLEIAYKVEVGDYSMPAQTPYALEDNLPDASKDPAAQASPNCRPLPIAWNKTNIHGHRVYYAVSGIGPTLVFLHGGGDSGEHSFVRQLDLFSEHHHIVAPDQVGQGRTPEVSGPLSYSAMMEGVLPGTDHATFSGRSEWLNPITSAFPNRLP
jgi:pimeloyl-ACP methyl ester carboxylesterase